MEQKAHQTSDASFASVIQGRSSSWFDVFVTLPTASAFGGFLTAAVWMLGLGGIFAPLYGLGTSTAGLTLFGIAIAVVAPTALLITLGIARWFVRDESLTAPINEAHLRAYAALALLMWLAGLTFLLLYLALATADSPAWPLVIGIILGTGPAFPLIGFIRSTKKFQDFTSWLDTALVVAVCVAALAWLAAESVFLFSVASSEADGTDRALIATVLVLLAAQAAIVLGRWAVPIRRPRAE
jgi:hypothetical protein